MKHPSPDARYLQLVREGLAGTDLTVRDPVQAVALGRQQCDVLSRSIPPATEADAVDLLRRQYTDGHGEPLSLQQAYAIVDPAIQIYCPQYREA